MCILNGQQIGCLAVGDYSALDTIGRETVFKLEIED